MTFVPIQASSFAYYLAGHFDGCVACLSPVSPEELRHARSPRSSRNLRFALAPAALLVGEVDSQPGRLRPHNFSQRGIAVPSPADLCQIYPAVLWWCAVCMERLHVLFPDASAVRLRVFAYSDNSVFESCPAGRSLHLAARICSPPGDFMVPLGDSFDSGAGMETWPQR